MSYLWGKALATFAAKALQTTLEGLDGLIKGDGEGGFTAVTDNSAVWDAAGLNAPIHTTKSADFTVTTAATIYEVTTGSSTDITASLPALSGMTAGQSFTFKKMDDGTAALIIDGNSSETIDGETTFTIEFQTEAVTIMCNSDKSGWIVV